VDPRSALADEVHVFSAPVSAGQHPDALALFRSWLSADEARRYERYLRPADAALFLAAHALLRHTLSLYAPVPPEDWSFRSGENGRPELSADFADLGLRFNLSHAAGLAACVITNGTDAGIDVEGTGRVLDPLALARTAFSAAEHRELAALDPEAAAARFYEIWTLKEAYIKALGLRLALIRHVVFTLERGRGVHVDFHAPVVDDPARWHFVLWRPTPTHQGALAVSRSGSEAPKVVFRAGLVPYVYGDASMHRTTKL
jgi:4'-phosphopantetheinyl transferase